MCASEIPSRGTPEAGEGAQLNREHGIGVPPAFRAHAAPAIAALRRQIADLAEALSLEPRIVSRARIVVASLNAEAIRLEDSLSPQLRGYGAVDPSVPERLDPLIVAMARELNSLVATLHHFARARG